MSSSRNRKYLARHPEVKIITTCFISEVIYAKPPDILRFAASFFKCVEMQDYVARSLGHSSKAAHITAIEASTGIINSTESSEAPANESLHPSKITTSYFGPSVNDAYQSLLYLSEKLMETQRRLTSANHGAMQDSTLLPENVSADVLTNEVHEILVCADGIRQLINTLPDVLATRRAAHLLNGLIEMFQHPANSNEAGDVCALPEGPVTLEHLLPLIDTTLWSSHSEPADHQMEFSSPTQVSHKRSVTTEPLSTASKASKVDTADKKPLDVRRTGLLLEAYLTDGSTTSSIPNALTMQDIEPVSGLSTSAVDETQLNTCKVTPSTRFLTTLLSEYDKIKEIPPEILRLDQASYTLPGILVQQPLSHFLAYPLMAPTILHLRSVLSNYLVVSRGGLLQWLSLFGFWKYEASEPNIDMIINLSTLDPISGEIQSKVPQSRDTRLLYQNVNPDLLMFLRTVAPHISGIGAEEFEYGILDVCRFLPQTYFCCANLLVEPKTTETALHRRRGTLQKLDANEVYVGVLYPSLPIRYLYSVKSVFLEIENDQFKLYKFLPLIVQSSYKYSDPSNICVVYTSILPVTYCDNIIPGAQLHVNLGDSYTSASTSSSYDFFTLPPSARLLEDINTEVHHMLEKAQITVSAIRYVLLSASTCYGRSSLTIEGVGNFLSNSWINTTIRPHKDTPNYSLLNILCFHEFMNRQYNTTEYLESLQQSDNTSADSTDVSLALLYSLWDMIEDSCVGSQVVEEECSWYKTSSPPLSKPYKRLVQQTLITKSMYTQYLDCLRPFTKFIQKVLLTKLPVVAEKYIYRDLLSCKIMPWLAPTEYVSFLAKTVHTPLLCYISHKIRDCACYYLPIISSYRATIAGKEEGNADTSDLQVSKAVINRLKHHMTDQKLVPSAMIDMVACFSARILAGGTPSYEHNDIHHDFTSCRNSSKDCSTTYVRDRLYETRSLLYPESTVASLLATFPSLFSAEAKLYLRYVTLQQLFDALYSTYSMAFGDRNRSTHIVCDSLPYLTTVGLYYDPSEGGKGRSFLFNLEKLAYDAVTQLKYSIAKDTIVSRLDENTKLLNNEHIVELARKHRLSSEEMAQTILLLIDEYMLQSPTGISRVLAMSTPWHRCTPMIVPLQPRHYNQMEERHEFDSTKSPINLHLTAGHALVGRYYPGFDPDKGVFTMEDHMRRAIYSLPFSVISTISSREWHLLDLIH